MKKQICARCVSDITMNVIALDRFLIAVNSFDNKEN